MQEKPDRIGTAFQIKVKDLVGGHVAIGCEFFLLFVGRENYDCSCIANPDLNLRHATMLLRLRHTVLRWKGTSINSREMCDAKHAGFQVLDQFRPALILIIGISCVVHTELSRLKCRILLVSLLPCLLSTSWLAVFVCLGIFCIDGLIYQSFSSTAQ